MSMQVIDEDQYTPEVEYGAGSHTLTREKIGTRYVLVAVRALVNPDDAKDLEAVHALQDAIKVDQPGGELRGKVGDGVNQAADLISATASIPSLNFIPLPTFGNWF